MGQLQPQSADTASEPDSLWDKIRSQAAKVNWTCLNAGAPLFAHVFVFFSLRRSTLLALACTLSDLNPLLL